LSAFARAFDSGVDAGTSPGPAGSRVRWTEDVELTPARLTRPFAPVTRLVTKALFAWMLRRLARELAAERAGRG
jgi:hypothetical protein